MAVQIKPIPLLPLITNPRRRHHVHPRHAAIHILANGARI
jgi:hypothetical protein